MSTLDIRTLALASVLVSLVMSIYMIHFQRTRKVYPGFWLWTTGVVLAGLGMLLLALRGVAPDWLSVVGANLFLGGALALTHLGVVVFCGGRPRFGLHLALILVLLAAIINFNYLNPDIVYRLVTMSLYLAYYSAASLTFCLRQRASLPPSNLFPALLSWAAFGLFHLIRAGYYLLAKPSLTDFLTAGTWTVWSMLIAPAIQVLLPVSLASLCNLRLEREVAQAQNQIQALSGLLPICANCKRIRDDSGYWHKVEQYISSHSQANFTHGICPQCIRELYPDMASSILEGSDTASPAPEPSPSQLGHR